MPPDNKQPPVFVAPPAPKTEKKGAPGTDTLLSLLVKNRLKAYQGSLGVIKQQAGIYGINAVELLMILAATGRDGTRGAIEALAPAFKNRDQFNSVNDWARANGIGFKFNPIAVVNQVTKNNGYSSPYTFADIAQSPTNSATRSVLTEEAKSAITDPWVVIAPNGKLKEVYSEQPPSKKLGTPVTQYGQPLRKSAFQQAWADVNDYYTAYIGRPAAAKEVGQFLNGGKSTYQLTTMLAKMPQFTRGKIWASRAPGIIGNIKASLGEGAKVEKALVRKAIVQNWDDATLARHIKTLPSYMKGPEYKQAVARLQNVHQSIMGTPADQDMINLHEAALEGWSADQYAAWVRGTDAYKSSPEAQSYAVGVAEALGLITGKQATLVPNGSQAFLPDQPKSGGAPPNSKRVAGNSGHPSSGPALGVGGY